MRVFVNRKSIGKNRHIITVPLQMGHAPKDLYDLIETIVKIMVEEFIDRKSKDASPLSDEQIDELADIGRISFGLIYNDNMPDTAKAVDDALLAYCDGLVGIFINDSIVEAVPSDGLTVTRDDLKKTPIELKEDDTVTFIRLTMLSGRMW